jgi:hypothetical protein
MTPLKIFFVMTQHYKHLPTALVYKKIVMSHL